MIRHIHFRVFPNRAQRWNDNFHLPNNIKKDLTPERIYHRTFWERLLSPRRKKGKLLRSEWLKWSSTKVYLEVYRGPGFGRRSRVVGREPQNILPKTALTLLVELPTVPRRWYRGKTRGRLGLVFQLAESKTQQDMKQVMLDRSPYFWHFLLWMTFLCTGDISLGTSKAAQRETVVGPTTADN